MTPTLFDRPDLRPTDVRLRPYQAEAIDAIRGELYHKKLNSTILILATGLGKTVIAGMIMRRIAERGGRSLFLAHRGELIDQAVETLTRLGLSPAIEKAKSYARAAWEPDVVVATVQSMQRDRLKQWPKDHFKLIISDECHHAISTTYQNIYRHFKAKHLGLTATPDRADEESLSEVFESVAYEYSLWDAMLAPAPGPYLSRLRFVQCDVGIDLRDIRTTGGDLNASDLEEAIRPHIEALANAIRQEVGDRKTLVFTPDVGSAMAMASALDAIGVRSRWVAGDSPDRKDIIEGYRRDEFQGLAQCNLCTEGFDVANIAAIGLCRPTKSRCLYTQMAGRGTRLYPGKENCILVDFNWLTAKHKLVRPTELFDTTRTDSETLAIAEELLQGELPLDAPGDAAGADLMDVIERAEVEKKRRTVLRIRAREREMRYRKVSYDPLAMMETIGVPVRAEADRFQGTITPGQRTALEKFGMTDDLDSLSKRRASQILDVLVARAHQNLARPRQVGALIRHGIEPEVARAMTFQEAHEALNKLFGRN